MDERKSRPLSVQRFFGRAANFGGARIGTSRNEIIAHGGTDRVILKLRMQWKNLSLAGLIDARDFPIAGRSLGIAQPSGK